MKISIVLRIILVTIFCLFCLPDIRAGNAQSPFFKVLVVASPHPDHGKMIRQAKPFLEELGEESNFSIDFSLDPAQINDTNLSRYQVFIQLHLASFEMSYQQQAALQKFIEQGKGWVGIHAAGLTGKQFIDSSTIYWQWYQDFFGGVVYSPHPAFQRGTVVVEDQAHPVTKNLPKSFSVWDEWYEFDKSPRQNVHVLATADETTFKQVIPMGDHPIIWTSEKYDRMVYIGIGHDTSVCTNPDYRILMRNAILWVARPKFRAIVLSENSGQHKPFTDAARMFM